MTSTSSGVEPRVSRAAARAAGPRNRGTRSRPHGDGLQADSLVLVGVGGALLVLLVALALRHRRRRLARAHGAMLPSQNALTGLLPPHLFTDRLRQVVARHRRDAAGAAVLYVQIVNLPPIRKNFGPAVAEQCVLRSVIKLRRLLRDVDVVSRVGDACFGVLLEGATSRATVTERAVRLIAAGLMPAPGLKPDVTLQFHVAAVLLNESPLEAQELEQALVAELGRMSPRTRRPIRFVEADGTHPDAGESSLFPPDADDPGSNGGLASAP
jgi:GGDEF domain-containing protein